MRRKWWTFPLIGATAVSLLATVASSQGRGYGRGMGNGYGRGMCAGKGLGVGGGGWWLRVSPQTPEQSTFVKKVTELHNRIWTLNRTVMQSNVTGDTSGKANAAQRELLAIRSELKDLTTKNSALLKEMGVPSGYGVCDGSGTGAWGNRGRGMGMRLRDGSGPNQNCPLK